MKKNISMFSKVGGLGLAGVLAFGASTVNAEQFNSTVLIQNALAIGTPTPLDFGTLYAKSANGSAISGITLAPNGDVSPEVQAIVGATGDAPPLISLVDGAVATGIVSTDADFNLIMPADEAADLGQGGPWVEGSVELSASADPDQAAFYLTDFEIGTTAGTTLIQNGGTGTPAATEQATAGTYLVEPGFGAESIEFRLGATIWTDGAGGLRTSYEAATYSGTFEVTAEFQ